MPIVDAPLFSLSASGTVGKLLTYFKRNGKNQVKGNRLVEDENFSFVTKKVRSQTVRQMAIRETFKNGTDAWNKLTAEQKQFYKDKAKPLPTSAVALFLKDYIKENYVTEEYIKFWLFSNFFHNNYFLLKKNWVQTWLIGLLRAN